MTWVAGLPPRMRGKMVDLSLQTLDLRITPAYARKSRTSAPALPGYRDHPRMRGENVLATSCRLRVLGSPPHARGKWDAKKHSYRRHGITPACAGKMTWYLPPMGGTWDHPRMRGENDTEILVFVAILGSPPHARGKYNAVGTANRCLGITPACAGKMRPISACASKGRDHPRMRGENHTRCCSGRHKEGSPPHARGKCFACKVPVNRHGITPACAGKIGLLLSLSCRSLGSPPHARGKFILPVRLVRSAGITPACAGKIRSQYLPAVKSRDHPRMRGENYSGANDIERALGSPPHARGKLRTRAL